MPLTTYNITGSLKDADGNPLTIGTVTFTPYATHDARVDGSNALLGPIIRDIATLPSPLVITAGNWTITIATKAKVDGREAFKAISTAVDIAADTTWGSIVGGAVASPEVTPTHVQQAQAAADEAEMWAAQSQAMQDNAVATLVGDTATPSLTRTRVDEAVAASSVHRTSRAQHAPALGLYFPEAEGAVGDGVTNDAPAITAARVAAGTAGQVVFKAGTVYGIGSTVAIAAGSRFIGNGATLKAVASIVRIATMASNSYAERLTFDGNGNVTSILVETVAAADGVTLNRCTITSGTGTGPIGFRTLDGTKNVLLNTCTFTNLTNTVKIEKGADTVRIRGCYFSGWYDRAIWCISAAGTPNHNIWIEGCLIRPHAVRLASGSPDMTQVRQPIAIQGVDTDKNRNVNVLNNVVIGAGTSHGDTTNPGSADLISAHRTSGLKVIGNTAEYGGDVGITVAQQCEHIVIANNITRFNDSAGICLGSAGSTSTTDATVEGNTSMNNGQNRLNDGPSWASNGINLNRCQQVTITGNRCGDGQATKTQLYGITAQNTTNVEISGNQTTGNLTSGFQNEGGNTRLSFLGEPHRVVMTADKVVNNSTVLSDVTALTVAVAPNGIYEVEAYLIYNSSTVADLSLKWVSPSGGPTDALDWITDAPASGTTSPNSVIQRTSFSIGSTATIGGGGVNAVATPRGVLTVGATAGNFKLQMAQGAAEVSDTIIRAGSWLRLTRIG